MAIIRSVDVGYGNVKYVASRTDEGIRCKMFPSWAPLASDLALDSGMRRTRDTTIVEVDEVRYEIGPDSRLGLKAHNVRILNNDYATSQEYLALLRGALSYMHVSEIHLLVVGLPVSLMNGRAQSLIRRLKGVHRLADGRSVHVHHVWALAQPLGGFYDHALGQGAADMLSDQVNLIIDPGYYTVDWLTTFGAKVMPERTGSFPGGVHAILQAMARGIGEQLGVSFTDIDAIDRALINGKLRLGGQTLDLSPHWQRAQPRVHEVMNAIANSVGDALDVENVILVGGGARLFEPVLRKRFHAARVIVAPEPIFANVRGFQAAGERHNALAV